MAISIVVTDGYTLNPGDLSWEGLSQFGRFKVYDRTPADQMMERCRDASVIVTNKTPVGKNIIEACPSLQMIAVTATGYNIVDTAAARGRNIAVCNVPGYGTLSVAQHTFALILELVNHVGENSRSVFKGEWATNKDWCYSIRPIVELNEKVMGIVGMGRIGAAVARIASAFGMQVIFYNPTKKQSDYQQVSMEDLFKQADVISLHCPLTKDNAQFVNARLLSIMKPSSYLINTSRGLLVNEQDLSMALKQERIAGAGLDVLSTEPPVDNPLIGIPRCLITPHNAWLSFEARSRIMKTTMANIGSLFNGRLQNVVN